MNTSSPNNAIRLQVSLYTGDIETPYTSWGRSFCNPLAPIDPNYLSSAVSVESIATFTEDVFNWLETSLSIPDKRKLESVFTIEFYDGYRLRIFHTDRFTYHQLKSTLNKRKTDVLTMLIEQLLNK